MRASPTAVVLGVAVAVAALGWGWPRVSLPSPADPPVLEPLPCRPPPRPNPLPPGVSCMLTYNPQLHNPEMFRLGRHSSLDPTDRDRAEGQQLQAALAVLERRGAREHWSEAERRAARFELGRGFLRRLGEEEYRRVRRGAKLPVLVSVRAVLPGSEAERIGLAPTDQLLRLAGERLYAEEDLRVLETRSEVNETLLEVRRCDEEVQIPVGRGPLGVEVDSTDGVVLIRSNSTLVRSKPTK